MTRTVAAATRALADRVDLPARAGRFSREVSVAVVAVLLVGVAAAGAENTEPAPAAAVSASPAPGPDAVHDAPSAPQRLAARTPDLTVAAAPKPAATAEPAPEPAPEPAVAKGDRWLPTGTGMWLHEWDRTEGGSAGKVIARSQQVGLSHLFVQTGSSKKGWIGQEVLSELMPATKGTDIKVIAWDFPTLIDPEADARRLARAAWWNQKGAPMVAAVAPDVETSAEGTRLSTDRVKRYYAELRKRLPARTAILATVPWPSEKRTGWYPYTATATYSDAFIPMAYWYNRSPSVVTKTSMQWLKRYGLPVMPVGQGYDGRLDAPYLKADPAPDKSVARFVYVSREQGAQSLSLWSWQTTGRLQWGELAKAAGKVGPRPAAEPVVVPTPSPEPQTAKDRARDKASKTAPGRQHDRRPKDRPQR
ncbi:MAG: hypothetical protein EPN99_12545 [Frankiales bacterium]|nr:MAG: hypothetical protein EPN99_12545 [Frankiales bacterium]